MSKLRNRKFNVRSFFPKSTKFCSRVLIYWSKTGFKPLFFGLKFISIGFSTSRRISSIFLPISSFVIRFLCIEIDVVILPSFLCFKKRFWIRNQLCDCLALFRRKYLFIFPNCQELRLNLISIITLLTRSVVSFSGASLIGISWGIIVGNSKSAASIHKVFPKNCDR
jgi:hypothetical protein